MSSALLPSLLLPSAPSSCFVRSYSPIQYQTHHTKLHHTSHSCDDQAGSDSESKDERQDGIEDDEGEGEENVEVCEEERE